jgi:hypothetical protein
VALSTASAAAGGGLVARPLQPERLVDFTLAWRDDTPAPALAELVRLARAETEPEPVRPAARALVSVA